MCNRPALRFFLIIFILSLSGCVHQQQDRLDECTEAVKKEYPNSERMPFGQPYHDIEACMFNAGYAPAYDALRCKSKTFPSNVMDATCYKPSNFFLQMIYDIFTLFGTL